MSQRSGGLIRLIGLAGKAGAGKDTVADYLARAHGYEVAGFADALRDEVCTAFGIPAGLLLDRKTKERATPLLALERCPAAGGYIEALLRAGLIHTLPDEYSRPRSPRWILQTWGTEYRRAQDADYWIHPVNRYWAALNEINDQTFGPLPRMVLPGVRFTNEVSWIHEHGGVVIRVHRPQAVGVGEHQSEAWLPDALIGATIDNSRTLAELPDAVLHALDRA